MSLVLRLLRGAIETNPRAQKLKTDVLYGRFLARVMYFSAYKLADAKKNAPASFIEHWAKVTPHAPAIYFEDRRYTYSNFNEEANRVASVLKRLGAKTDESVALLMENRPEYLFTIIGANKLGMVTGLINTKLVGDQLTHALNITEANWLIVGSELAHEVEAIADTLSMPRDHILVWNDGETAATVEGALSMDERLTKASTGNLNLDVYDPKRRFIYICTSGTTGLPKAALIGNQRFLRAVHYFGKGVLQIKASDVMYTAGMPLYHNAGISQGWGVCITSGAACVIRRKFSVSGFWDDCDRYGATLFTYIGEICRYLLNGAPHARERSHRLRGMLGAGLRPEVWAPFVERFQIPQVFEYYGATEGNVGLVNLTNRMGSVGRLLPGQEIVRVDADTEEFERDAQGHLIRAKVGESGIILGKIRPMAEFDGYVDRSKNDSKIVQNPFGKGDTYFNTGDLLTLHDNGFVSFADRLGDTFRWKGENVSTNDVQEMLVKYEGVAEANVYGVKVEGHDGRAGAAALLIEDGFDLGGFAAHVREHLPAYARPLFIRIEEELPMTGSYKYVKTGFKREGFDPAQIATPLYFLDDAQGYVPLDAALYARIQAGEIRL